MKKAVEAVFKIESLLFVLIVGFITFFYVIGWFTRIENMYLDAMTNNLTDTTVKVESAVVYSNTSDSCFKEAEIYYQMGWPWKRTSYNKIIDFVKQSGGKLTVFDATSQEKSVYSYLGLNDDENFARFMKEAGNVIYGMVLGSNEKQLKEGQKKNLLRLMNFRTVKENDKEWLGRMKSLLNKDQLAKLKLSGKDLDGIKASKLLERMKEKGLLEDKELAKKIARTSNKETETKRNNRIRKLLTPARLKKIGHKAEDAKNADSDKLAKLLYKVLIDIKVNVSNKPSLVRNAIPHNKIRIIDKKNFIPVQYNYLPPTKVLESAPLQLGTTHGDQDVDGIVRRKALIVKYGDYYYPSLAFAAVYQYLKPEIIEIRKDSITLVNPKDKINRKIHLTTEGVLRLKYYGVSNAYFSFRNIDMFRVYDHINVLYDAYKKIKGIKHIEKAKLFEHSKYIALVRKAVRKVNPGLVSKISPKDLKAAIRNQKMPGSSLSDQEVNRVRPESFKNKIVLMGNKATSLMDIRPIPLDNHEMGTHIHATAIDNILKNDTIREVRGSWHVWLAIIILGLLTFIFTRMLSIVWGALTMLIMVTLTGFTSVLLYVYANIIMDTASSLSVILLTFVSFTLINYFRDNKQKKYIQGAFGQYLSPKVIEIIINDPDKLNLGGVRREITAFFSDVAGFSTISEKLTPEELVALLNVYLTEMCDIIAKYDGVVDKFEGDAIIAFWGAPLEQPDHAILSCYTSIEMQLALAEMRKRLAAEGRDPLIAGMKMRIGLNSGPAVVGNMGSSQRMDYTMMGDTVNLAARLEGANKFYSTFSMISDGTYERAKNHIEARELDKIRVVGKNEPVT
ncbi:MAG: adenylate/guanylate cyclase domain-containing protein, partial [Spirochaetota bacterium]|nr:adenylate/guanylate cyclase domain-containing protein [Spirochaetota bacterium]